MNLHNSASKSMYRYRDDLRSGWFEIPLEDAPKTNHRFMGAGCVMLKFGIGSTDYDS